MDDILETKVFRLEPVKADDDTDAPEGRVKALFVRFNDMDKDGDITLPGAIGKQDVVLASYGHNYGSLPVGKGRIREEGDIGVFEGEFFTDTAGGSDTYRTLKQLGPLQEWSYMFRVDDYRLRKPKAGENSIRYDGMIREFKKVTVKEVSPVMVGAGRETQTLDIKGCKNCGLNQGEEEQPETEPPAPAPAPEPEPEPAAVDPIGAKLFLEYQKNILADSQRAVMDYG